MYKELSVCFVIVLTAFIGGTIAVCPNQINNPTILQSPRGRITYTSASNDVDCTWKLPPIPSHHHAIQFYLKETNLKRSGNNRCSGIVFLPNTGRICEASTTCRTYVRIGSTCRISEIKSKSFPPCTSNIIHTDDEAQKEVKYQALSNGGGQQRSFNLAYKIINCDELATDKPDGRQTLEGKPLINATTTTDYALNTTSLPHKFDDLESEAFSSITAAIVAIIVILFVLLLGTCFMLVQMYKRKQKAVTFQNPAVVAYVHDRFDDDSSSSYQTPAIEYLDFPRSDSAISSSDTFPRECYANIDMKSSDETENTKDPGYENVTLDSNFANKSSDNLVLNLEFSPDCTYATVNKGCKTQTKSCS